jgi:hypothetical protein
LDFVDVDVEWDTKVFISPRALTLMQTEWGDGCVTLVQNFFETVLQRIKDGDNVGAEALLQELREPNETHLGLSHAKSRGRALGDASAHNVWRALIPACADFDSRWDSQDADFLIRCSEQEEARDGGSDWGSNGLHIGGFAAVGAALW